MIWLTNSSSISHLLPITTITYNLQLISLPLFFGPHNTDLINMSRRDGMRVYVGNLSTRVRRRDIEDEMDRYGRIGRCDMMNGFAFVEFDDYRDAKDAIHDVRHGFKTIT